MNKIYKKVWNKLRGCFVAVSEAMSSNQARGKAAAVIVGVATSFLTIHSANAEDLILGTRNHQEYSGGGTYGTLQLGNPGSQDRSLPYKGNYEHDEVKSILGSSVTLNDGDWVFDKIENIRTNARATVSGRFKYFNIGNEIFVNNSNVTAETMVLDGLYQLNGGSTKLGSVTMNHYQGAQGGHAIDSHAYGYFEINDADFSVDSILFNDNYDRINYKQVGGTGYIGEFLRPENNTTNTGKVVLSNTDMTFGNLNSFAIVTAEDSDITIGTLSLTSQTLTGSNSDLTTGFDQVGNLTETAKTFAKLDIAADGNDSAQGVIDGSALGTKQDFGGLKSEFTDNVVWNGGSMHFKGSFSETVASQITDAIHSAFGSDVNVSFESTFDDLTEQTDGLTTANINTLMQAAGNREVILYTTVWNANNQAQTIGLQADADSIGQSIGFKVIRNADGVTVEDGKTLVLIGENASTKIADGTLTVDNGTLRLGSSSEAVAKGGRLEVVVLDNNGRFIAQGGEFSVDSVSGNGDLTVRDGKTKLTVTSLNLDGDILNEGAVTVAQAAKVLGGSNSGTLSFASGLSVDGELTNAGNVSIAGKLDFGDDGRFEQTSGELTTGLDNVFQNVTPSVVDPLKVIGLNASLPEEIRTVATDLFQKYVPGEVAEVLADHATFSGGKVTITGVNLTNTQVADLTQAFKEQLFSRNSLTSAFPVALL